MEEQRKPGISRIATKYGLILGVLSFVVFLASALLGMSQSRVLTLVGLVLLVVLMVLAHREFRKTHDGMMTYGQGVGSGTLLSVVSSIVSGVLAYVYVKFINTGYFAALLEAQRAALEQRGITGARAEQAMAMTSAIMTPGAYFIASLIFGVIGGLIIALLVSIFTQEGDPKAVI